MSNFQEILPKELEKKIKQGNPLLIWDIREPEEWEGGCLPHAIRRPLSQMSNWLPEINEIDTPIVIYCHSGVRSAHLCEWMSEQGLESIFNLTGGIVRWAKEGKFLEK